MWNVFVNKPHLIQKHGVLLISGQYPKYAVLSFGATLTGSVPCNYCSINQ